MRLVYTGTLREDSVEPSTLNPTPNPHTCQAAVSWARCGTQQTDPEPQTSALKPHTGKLRVDGVEPSTHNPTPHPQTCQAAVSRVYGVPRS